MCGLFGSASQVLSTREIKATMELGIVSSLRGYDSTGLVTRRMNKGRGSYLTFKDVDCASVFFSRDTVDKMIDKTGVSMMMGHTRSATVGEITQANAHPFREGKIIGCHNGTIYGLREKDSEETDSQKLYKKINSDGLIPSLKAHQTGAYALSFVDLGDDSVKFVRNKERPIYFAITKELSTFWASEEDMLTLVLKRNNLDILEEYLLPEHTLATIDLKNRKHVPELTSLKEDLTPERTFSSSPSTAYSVYRSDWWDKRAKEDCERENVHTEKQIVDSPFKPQEISPNIKTSGSIRSYIRNLWNADYTSPSTSTHGGVWLNGKSLWIDIQDFKELLGVGCLNCGSVEEMETDEAGETKCDALFNSHMYVCEDCFTSLPFTQNTSEEYREDFEKPDIYNYSEDK